MATTKAPRDLEIGSRQTPAAHPPAPPTVLEQARLGNLDLFRTELESGHHPLDFKAGRAVYFNRTPLHLAAMEGHEEIVEFILSRPEICREVVNAKDGFGYTPLHLAVRHSHESVVRLLTTSSWVLPDRFLTATREPDDIGAYYGGFTPLHLAAVTGHIAIARLLLRQPCDVEFDYHPVNIFAMTWLNSTPLDLARRNNFQGLANIMEASDLNWLQQETARTATSANAILVGAALVAAAAFGALLQTLGGMPNPESGAPSPSPSASSSSPDFERNRYSAFYFWDTFAFSCSVASLLLGIWATFPYKGPSSIVDLYILRRALYLARFSLLVALAALLVAFSIVSYLVFDKVASGNKYVEVSAVSLPSFAAGIFIICTYAVRGLQGDIS